LRDDGNLDGRRLKKALGERDQGFTLLEHHPMPYRNERRSLSTTPRHRHECMEPCRDLFVSQTASRVAKREPSARARSTDPLRECSVKLTTASVGAEAD
jgi:hypothetical protein